MTATFSRLCLGAALLAAASASPAQSYPSRPIQLIAQQPPGSGSDALTRAWADCAARGLGQPVVVQNRPGANGVLAVNSLKSQPADGYTLMSIGMSQMSITPYVYRNAPYVPEKDFDDIGVLGTTPLVLAVPAALGVTRLDQLAALGRGKAGGLDFGSPGKGSPAHLLTTALVESMGVAGTHVPFVGESAGLTALMGEQIQAMTLVIGTAVPHVKAGKLNALALFGQQRSPLLPQVPTVAEALPAAAQLSRPSWISIVARAGTPPAMLARLSEVTRACNADTGYRTRMEAMNVTVTDSRPGEAREWAVRDAQMWRPLIERL
ncbi:MAG: tripartite tricarboxylate transporter substrate binding protein, partial [Comamonadaceae bacterium]